MNSLTKDLKCVLDTIEASACPVLTDPFNTMERVLVMESVLRTLGHPVFIVICDITVRKRDGCFVERNAWSLGIEQSSSIKTDMTLLQAAANAREQAFLSGIHPGSTFSFGPWEPLKDSKEMRIAVNGLNLANDAATPTIEQLAAVLLASTQAGLLAATTPIVDNVQRPRF